MHSENLRIEHRCTSNYNVQLNIRIVENRWNIGWYVLPNVQQLVPGESDCRNIGQTNKNSNPTVELHTEVTISGAILEIFTCT